MRNKFEGDKIIKSIVIVLTGLNKTKKIFFNFLFPQEGKYKNKKYFKIYFQNKIWYFSNTVLSQLKLTPETSMIVVLKCRILLYFKS